MENSEFSKTVYKEEWFCHLQIKKMENFERVHKEEWCSVISGSIFSDQISAQFLWIQFVSKVRVQFRANVIRNPHQNINPILMPNRSWNLQC